MNKLVLDSSAWIEYFNSTPAGIEIGKMVESKASELFLTGLTVAEICSKYLKEGRDAAHPINALRTITRPLPFDERLGLMTAKIYVARRKKKRKFGLIDAHLVAAAQMIGGIVITCDHDFEGMALARVVKKY